MNLRRILAILGKDLKDASRDGRVGILLLLPIVMAVFFNATTPKEGELPNTTVVLVQGGAQGLGTQLKKAAERTADLKIRRAGSEREARDMLDDDRGDFAVIGQGVEEGEPARATVLLPDGAGATATAVVSNVSNAVAAAAGRQPPSQVRVESYAIDAATQKPADVIDRKELTIGILIVTLAGLVALVAVPIQTAEELETGTFGALRLAASGPEIFLAKALAGLVYGVVSLILIVRLTDLSPDEPLLFWGASVGLLVSLVGFGILLGLLSRNATAINTYGTFLLFPIVGAAVGVLFVEDGPLKVLLDVLPFSQATKLLFDGLSPERPFDAGLVSWAVLAAWTVAGYVLLTRIASRREV